MYSLFLFCIALFSSSSFGLYEDQIGKFDWRKQFLGQVSHVYMDAADSSVTKLIVATQKNALASLNIRTGEIVWRNVYERGEAGKIDALSSSNALVSVSHDGEILRVWDPSTGVIISETMLHSPPCPGCKKLYHVSSKAQGVEGGGIYQLVSVQMDLASLRTKVAIFSLPGSGEGSEQPSPSLRFSPFIPTPWLLPQTECRLVTGDYLVCASQESLYLLPIISNGEFIHIPLSTFGITSAKLDSLITFSTHPSPDKPIFAIQHGESSHIFQIVPPGIQLLKSLPQASHLTSVIIEDKFYVAVVHQTDIEHKISLLDWSSWEAAPEYDGGFEIAKDHGAVDQVHILPYQKKDKSYSYKVMVTAQDHAILLYHQLGKPIWCREEALASILTTEMVDLPLSETDANIEKEFGHSNGSLLELFATRIATQLIQLQNFMLHLLSLAQGKGSASVPTPSSKASSSGSSNGPSEEILPGSLTRDKFGLHKVIVVATAAGKVFGIDNLSGHLVWKHLVPGLMPFRPDNKEGTFLLFVQRTTAFYPHPPQLTILGQSLTPGKSYLYSVNPITGQIVDSQALPYRVIQATLLGHSDDTHLKPVLLLDADLQVHIYPEHSMDVLMAYKDVHYIFTADVETGTVQGYSLALYPDPPVAMKVWNLNFPKSSQTILKVATKRPTEHVHSQGRVMGDRSVLYKYINPNLALIVTEGTDNMQKTNINIYLVDVVTGSIVYASSHKRAKGPVHVVHSENWAVYSYFNERSRRVEISALELYEGKVQSNTTAFSSLAAPPRPLVEHQTFIFPAGIDAMVDTITERGLTNKHILIALPGGGVVEVPRMFLDPRRPIYPTNEHREEGLIPYLPELTIPSEGIINYNQSIIYVRGIHTAPAGLESTCLVFVYGLDIFFTRVTPSKTFDVLKDDFDHYLISAVLLALIAVSLITKRLATLKALRQAWK